MKAPDELVSIKQNDCLYPDWEGEMIRGKHILDKDGYCNICGKFIGKKVVSIVKEKENKR